MISEQRRKNADGYEYARRIGGQVVALEEAGVLPEHITVVGASKGASIAAAASFQIKDPLLNFVLLGTCHPDMLSEWKSGRMKLYGNVLAIGDAADTEYSGSCEELFGLSDDTALRRHEEILLHTGLGHGFLYKPMDEWILPTLDWASR